jgi:hypothetical protein
MTLKSQERRSHLTKIIHFVQCSSTKSLTPGLWGCLFHFYIIFIFSYFILLGKCYVSPQMIVVIFVWETIYFIIFIFYSNTYIFFFFFIIWWGIGIASKSKLEMFKNSCFNMHNCFYCFLPFYLNILFYYYYSNIPYSRRWL